MKLLCVALCCIWIQSALATTVKVVVVEGRATDDGNKSIQSNLELYRSELNGLKFKNIHIIVLPEYGLTGLAYKSTSDYANRIDHNMYHNENVNAINEFAKEFSPAYVVANLLEKDGQNYFSTTIVVNGSAQLVAKYRKMRLNSAEKNLRAGDDVGVFESPILGTVGLISGDDIFYDNPSQTILKKFKIDTVIYTTAFQSVLPFKSALSVQQGYAQANDINLLAANLNNPKEGYGGSGIYSGDKILASYVDATLGTKVLEADLDLNRVKTVYTRTKPIFTTLQTTLTGTKKKISDFKFVYSAGDMDTKLLTKQNLQNFKHCYSDLCCTFNITGSWETNVQYRTAVRGGKEKGCALIVCNGNGSQCGNRTDDIHATFVKIQIKTSKNDMTFRPYSLLSSLEPLDQPDVNTHYSQNKSGVFYEISNNTYPHATKMLVFGIVTQTTSGANSLQAMAVANLLIAFIFIFKHFI